MVSVHGVRSRYPCQRVVFQAQVEARRVEEVERLRRLTAAAADAADHAGDDEHNAEEHRDGDVDDELLARRDPAGADRARSVGGDLLLDREVGQQEVPVTAQLQGAGQTQVAQQLLELQLAGFERHVHVQQRGAADVGDADVLGGARQVPEGALDVALEAVVTAIAAQHQQQASLGGRRLHDNVVVGDLGQPAPRRRR